MKNWILFAMLVAAVVAAFFADVGTHIHFVDEEGVLVGVQDYRCPEKGHLCPTVEHNCDGDFAVVITQEGEK